MTTFIAPLEFARFFSAGLKRAAIFNATIHQPMIKREMIHLTLNNKVDSELEFRDRVNPIPWYWIIQGNLEVGLRAL